MYYVTKNQILEIIEKNDNVSAKQLVVELGLTQASIHRALNKLLNENKIVRKGSPPKVFYSISKDASASYELNINSELKKLVDENYVYISPEGKVVHGVDGFMLWMKSTKNLQKPENCMKDYSVVLLETFNHKHSKLKLIDASKRMNAIFSDCALNSVYYSDFYSLIKFGKTKLGQYLLNGKQSQNKKMIRNLATQIQPEILKLIAFEKIDAIAWVPHSIPRKVPFLKELAAQLNLSLPVIEVLKAYSGDIPIAQKSLAKIEERIQNARETMIVTSSKITAKKVLLIDDAVA